MTAVLDPITPALQRTTRQSVKLGEWRWVTVTGWREQQAQVKTKPLE